MAAIRPSGDILIDLLIDLVAKVVKLDDRVRQLEYPQGHDGNLPSWCKRCGWEIDGDRHLTDMPSTSGWDDTRRFLPCSLCGREA